MCMKWNSWNELHSIQCKEVKHYNEMHQIKYREWNEMIRMSAENKMCGMKSV
jgi:hypothetical protein